MHPDNTLTLSHRQPTKEESSRWRAHRAIRRIIEAFRGRVLPIDLVVLDFIRGDLARDGYTTHSLGFIATGCGVAINTIRRAIRRWIDRGIIEPIERTGMATIHRLTGSLSDPTGPGDSTPPATPPSAPQPPSGDSCKVRRRLRDWIRERRQPSPSTMTQPPPTMDPNSDPLRGSKTTPSPAQPPAPPRPSGSINPSRTVLARYRDLAADLIRSGASRAEILNTLRAEITGRNESRLLRLGTSPRMARRLINRYPPERIASVLNASDKTNPTNPGGWVYAALTRNWTIGDHHAER